MAAEKLQELYQDISKFSDLIKKELENNLIEYKLINGDCTGQLLYQSKNSTVNHSYWGAKKGSAFPFHEHGNHEIIIIKKGSMKLIIDSTTRILKEGDSIYIAPNTPHGTGQFTTDCEFETVTIPEAEGFPGAGK